MGVCHCKLDRINTSMEVVWEVNWKSLGMDSVKELDDDGS